MRVDRGNRTYYLSDERLRTFRALPAEDKLRWVEELAAFLRMTRPSEYTNVRSEKTRKP